jgi:hypothetical protein
MNHCGHCLNAFPGDVREILCPKCNEAFQKDMTIEETKEAIKVMQAFVDGKKIEITNNSTEPNTWTDFYDDSPTWNWYVFSYRIKPEPKEFWIVGGSAYADNQLASCYARTNNLKVIHVREVV